MRVLILLACVAFALADECGPLQRLKVKSDWHQIYSVGLEREAVGRELWEEFFSLAPNARSLFSRVRGDNIHSADFVAHSARLLGGLDMAIHLLDEPEVLQSQLAHLKGQHDPRNIPADYWGPFKIALAHTVMHHLDHKFDQDAWAACASVIAKGIRG